MAEYLSYLPERLSQDEVCLVDPSDALHVRLRDDRRLVCRHLDSTAGAQSAGLAALVGHHVGFLSALAALGEPSVGWAAILTPITQAADLRDVRISAMPRLDSEDADAILSLLNDLLTEDPDERLRRLRVRYAASTGQWFLVGTEQHGPEFLAHCPQRLLGQPLRDHPITGPDAGLLKRWFTEVQMALYASDVNRRRALAGQPPVNGIWLHGAGPRPLAPDLVLPPLVGDDILLRGVWEFLNASVVTTESLGGHTVCGKAPTETAWRLLVEGGLKRAILLAPSGPMVARRARWHHKLRRLIKTESQT
ncbi:MAG: hypothetical protein AAFN07_03900 [Pseudomonadota bacterium]